MQRNRNMQRQADRQIDIVSRQRHTDRVKQRQRTTDRQNDKDRVKQKTGRDKYSRHTE